MAASRPTGSLLQEIRVIDVSDENMPGLFLLLEMTFQTKRRVPLVEQSLVHRAVGRMADHTALSHCFVLVNKRAALLGVALEASLVSAQESEATGSECLLNISPAAFDCDPLVRIMAIAAAHFAFQDRMMMRQLECRANFQVTLETSFRRFPRIDDRASPAAGFNVQTPGAVARFAAHVLGVLPFCLEPRVRRRAKVAHDLFVAGPAFL
jgi:hypothetical protein